MKVATVKRSARAPKAGKSLQAKRPRRAHVLRLYVAGASDRSRHAILRARQFCDELGSGYVLEVIDVYQQPILARDGQIVATPTLVKEFPQPVRRFIGDLSNLPDLFVGLEVDTRGKART